MIRDSVKKSVQPGGKYRYVYIIGLLVLSIVSFLLTRFLGNNDTFADYAEIFENNGMVVHFVDVGQGDCILIQDGIHNILIDTGSTKANRKVVDYLDMHNVEKLDMIVLTHPHEDHIGSFDEVVEQFLVKLVVKSAAQSDSSTYKNLIRIIQEQNIRTIDAQYGQVYVFGDMVFTVISDKIYDDLNNSSVVMRLDHQGNSFLFTGDIESKSEHDILERETDIECDVLKVAHHGSSSSTTASFLFKASPVYAVIQCGAENEYGHPHKTILTRMDVQAVNVYRNDLSGDIVCISMPTGLSFKFEKDVANAD